MLTRCLDKCPAMSMTCFCPSLPTREAIGCFPSSASKPLNALPKLFSLFRKWGEKLEAPVAPLPHLKRKKLKNGGSGLGGTKRSKLLEFLTSSPLRSAGESEDNGGNGSPITTSLPPIAARPIAAAAPPPKSSLALEYSAMEPDSNDELIQEIQSVLATTELHAKTSAAAPLSLNSSSTSSNLSSSSSGKDVEGSGPSPQRHATAPETG